MKIGCFSCGRWRCGNQGRYSFIVKAKLRNIALPHPVLPQNDNFLSLLPSVHAGIDIGPPPGLKEYSNSLLARRFLTGGSPAVFRAHLSGSGKATISQFSHFLEIIVQISMPLPRDGHLKEHASFTFPQKAYCCTLLRKVATVSLSSWWCKPDN